MLGLYEDPSTPSPSSVVASSGIAYSATFSPPASTLVVVEVSWLFASSTTATISCKDTNNNAYTLKAAKQDASSATISAIFEFYYTTAPGDMAVEVTCSSTGSASATIAPRVLVGASTAQTSAATAAIAGNAESWVGGITTTTAGSLVYVVASGSLNSELTPIANTTVISAWNDTPVGDTSAVGVSSNATGTPGTITYGFTATGVNPYGFAAVEIIPAVAGSGGSSSGGTAIPVLTPVTAGTVVQAADLNNMAYACKFLMNKPICRVHTTTAGQALGGGTAINFDTLDFDTDGMWSPATPSQLTIQTPGFYKVRYMTNQFASGLNGNTWIEVTNGINNPAGAGTTVNIWRGYVIAVTNLGPCGSSGVIPLYLYAQDYVQVFFGGNISSNVITVTEGPYLSLELVSI